MRVIDAHVHTLDDYQPMTPFQDMGRVDRLLQWFEYGFRIGNRWGAADCRRLD